MLCGKAQLHLEIIMPFSGSEQQAQWFLPLKSGARETQLFKSCSGTAAYRIHNSGPAVITVNDDTSLGPGETIDIRQNQIRVALADGNSTHAIGWYQFIDGPPIA